MCHEKLIRDFNDLTRNTNRQMELNLEYYESLLTYYLLNYQRGAFEKMLSHIGLETFLVNLNFDWQKIKDFLPKTYEISRERSCF